MDSNDGEPELDTEHIQYYTAMNRGKYTMAIQKLLSGCRKRRIKTLENQNTVPVECEDAIVPKLNNIELDILNTKLATDVKNTLNKQIQIMKILNRKKNCPISKEMDKL